MSKTPIDGTKFLGNTAHVVFAGTQDDDSDPCPHGLGEVQGLKFGRVFTIEGEYYFYFEELSEEQRKFLQLKADIEYLAMMTEVEL